MISRRRGEGFEYRGAQGNFLGGGTVLYLDFSVGYMTAHIYQNSWNCTMRRTYVSEGNYAWIKIKCIPV